MEIERKNFIKEVKGHKVPVRLSTPAFLSISLCELRDLLCKNLSLCAPLRVKFRTWKVRLLSLLSQNFTCIRRVLVLELKRARFYGGRYERTARFICFVGKRGI